MRHVGVAVLRNAGKQKTTPARMTIPNTRALSAPRASSYRQKLMRCTTVLRQPTAALRNRATSRIGSQAAAKATPMAEFLATLVPLVLAGLAGFVGGIVALRIKGK